MKHFRESSRFSICLNAECKMNSCAITIIFLNKKISQLNYNLNDSETNHLFS